MTHAYKRVVLIADRTNGRATDFDLDGDGLEQIPDEYYWALSDGLASIFSTVSHFNTPADFIDRIEHHRDDIVFTIYGGHSSRNRMSLVPAICESYGVAYVGADVWARTVCQDKFLAKNILRLHSIPTPSALLVRRASDFDVIEQNDAPVVVKPNLEGSSIGITQNSICVGLDQTRAQCASLLRRGFGPILIEDYVPGREVVVCLIGESEGGLKQMEAVEILHSSDMSFFKTHLYSADIKHSHVIDVMHRIVTDEIEPQTLSQIKELFLSIGKMDYMRVDGRLDDEGRLHVIELTPDAYISSDSSFADIYRLKGRGYSELLEDIIQTASNSCRTQYPTHH